MSNDLESVTREVWNNYIDLNTTHRIVEALAGMQGYYPLRIVAYGRQGSGKTTFMYYAVKVAYVRYLCHKDRVTKDTCLEHAIKEYNLCLGRDCPRDSIDDELMKGFYITVDDLLRRFIEDVKSGAIAGRRIVFFDDAFTPKQWWLQGGKWRELYRMAKDFDKFYRDNINVLVLTAPALSYFTREYIVNSLVLKFDAVWLNGVPYTVAYRFKYSNYTHYDYGKPYLVRAKWIDFIDKVPFKRPYGIPRWLENLNTERRQYVLREVAKRALEAVMKSDEK